jgi:hypothetical protein
MDVERSLHANLFAVKQKLACNACCKISAEKEGLRSERWLDNGAEVNEDAADKDFDSHAFGYSPRTPENRCSYCREAFESGTFRA